jgi:radical SAM protein with 4Fe4S-binding SPASM domain
MNAKKPEIIFLYPIYYNGHCLYHLGAGYIIAYLRQKGISAEQFVNTRPLRMTELARGILDKGAKILGFTCYDQNYFFIKLLVKYLKGLDPGIFIVAGGPTATFSDTAVLKHMPEVDACVRGEGEFAVYGLMSSLRDGGDFRELPGLTFRRGNAIIRNADNPLIRHGEDINAQLDILPSPYLSGVLDPDKFLANDDPIPVLTSRGCIYKCTYCNFSAISQYTIRYHSVERVAAELTRISKLTRHKDRVPVTFEDDCFTLNHARVRQLCHYLIRNNLDNLYIDFHTRADYVNENILKLLFKAGARKVCFGLESASPRVLYNIKKVRVSYANRDNFGPEKKFIKNVESAVRTAKKTGFETTISIILGLPGESLQDGLTTIDFVKKLRPDRYTHNALGVFAGTELFKKIFKGDPEASESRISHSLPVSQRSVYRYDVYGIPPLVYAISNRVMKNRAIFLNSSLSLSGSFWGPGKSGSQPEMILTDERISVKTLLKNLPPEAGIFFGKNLRSLSGKHKARIKISGLYLAEILRPPFHAAGPGFSVDGFLNKIQKGEYRFEKFFFYDDYLRSSGENKNMIFAITDDADIDVFEKLLIRARDSSFEGQIKGKNNCILLDACRWSHTCPAREPERLLIDKNYNILPCFQGKILGRLGSHLDEIRNNYTRYWGGETKKRRCEDCEIRESCSQCPFLGNIEYPRYCSIKRKYSALVEKFIFLLQCETAIKTNNDSGRSF